MAEDIFKVSDDEFQNMNPPEITDDSQPKDSEPEPKAKETEEPAEENTAESANSSEESSDEPAGETQDTKKTSTDGEKASAPPVDYEAFYKTVMAPLKANGKTLELRDANEAIKLMQMGANYTQKMQNLAPYRKKIQMLQKANLLDDEKLNYLIDLSSGNTEAIKRLLKDNRIDPMDLNLDENKYIPGNHTLSDEESRLQTVLDDLTSTPEGIETVNLARGWDQASLGIVGKDPSVLSTLHEQRMNGVYDLIMKEMDHQRMLGNIPEQAPFLEAYRAVGLDLLQRMKKQQEAKQQQTQNLPVGTLNKTQSTDNSRVKSAAPSGRSHKSAQNFVDPFTLSDEEFEKQFKNYI